MYIERVTERYLQGCAIFCERDVRQRGDTVSVVLKKRQKTVPENNRGGGGVR